MSEPCARFWEVFFERLSPLFRAHPVDRIAQLLFGGTLAGTPAAGEE